MAAAMPGRPNSGLHLRSIHPPTEPPVAYTLRLEGRPQTTAKVAVAGGESLELFVSTDGTRLEHRRYDGGTEQGIRARHEDLPDPTDAQQRWFVAAHLPKREGSAAVRFPVRFSMPTKPDSRRGPWKSGPRYDQRASQASNRSCSWTLPSSRTGRFRSST